MADDSSGSASWASPGAGITGGYDGNSQTLRYFIVFFGGLAMFSACELIIIIFLTFKKFSGLYFWSMLVSGLGIIPYSLGFMLKFMSITTGRVKWLSVVLLTLGWYPMITGQSFVLWSRLHLIVSGERGDKIISYTKWMIIFDAIILHIPTTVLTFGSNGSLDTGTFMVGYNIMEKIQMIGFFIQEVVLSSIYIVETIKILRHSLQPGTQKIMKQLIFINVVIIIMDLALLGLESASLYILETLLKGVVYSIKLKLEFAILGKLVKFVGSSSTKPAGDNEVRKSSIGFITTAQGGNEPNMDICEFVDLTRVNTDVRYASGSHGHSGSVASRCKNLQPYATNLEIEVARFEHVEDVATLSGRSISGREAEV